jgi:hypothetical protein
MVGAFLAFNQYRVESCARVLAGLDDRPSGRRDAVLGPRRWRNGS